ncbi:hypothetical protein PVK06_002663 [Gossypium arboreum]|uniref:Retrotransposon gag domain-containing protein n=1 Tax=Gossypium arboreum TaxID=29729 RepID=A0ABR0R5B0_GOSAR|nr:hypothetical protein PVK06_002663 [Gossypium arboreum]
MDSDNSGFKDNMNMQDEVPSTQDMDWLFCSNNPLAPEIVAVSLPHDFKVLKDMFEGKRDLQAYLMQYNDYMTVLEASNAAKYKAFSIMLREVPRIGICPSFRARVFRSWCRYFYKDLGPTK